ncbi:MAG: ATP synthase F0 subunit B [Candidatus Gracilibacteria bacterium]|nr:ATP synthase F0 subunit B [Candidatus Gracilibacteria bacterium]
MENLKLELIFAAMINFGILFFMFKHFLGEKLANAIEERRKFLKASAEADDIAKNKLEDAEKEVEKILNEARAKASDIEKSADELSKQNTAKILEKAEKEAVYVLERAKTEIEKDRLDMNNSMKSKILDLSLKLNSKIFSKESANKDFFEKELEVLTK